MLLNRGSTGERIKSHSDSSAVSAAFKSALGSHDWTAFRSLLTEDAEWTLPGTSLVSGRATGADAAVARAQTLVRNGVLFDVQHAAAANQRPPGRRVSAAGLVREGANVMVFPTFDKIHGLAGMPIGHVLAPAELSEALRQQGAGDAEGLGRLNLAAASAALGDTAHVERIRTLIARERAKWLALLRKLKSTLYGSKGGLRVLRCRTAAVEIAAGMFARGVNIGRAHPSYTTWARITIGLPEENLRAQANSEWEDSGERFARKV